jgi:major vault protein
MIRELGAYFTSVDEETIGKEIGMTLNDTLAIHLRAIKTFVDFYGVERRAGDEWLITNKHAECHIKDIHEEIVGSVKMITLNKRQYCNVLNPVDEDGNNRYGCKELRKGESMFFLQPGEILETGIQEVIVLGEDESILLKAKQSFKDGKTDRLAGSTWLIFGPIDFIPTIQVQVLEKRGAIPLAKNEGVYVRNKKNGEVRLVRGEQTYYLTNDE